MLAVIINVWLKTDTSRQKFFFRVSIVNSLISTFLINFFVTLIQIYTTKLLLIAWISINFEILFDSIKIILEITNINILLI